MMHAGAMLRANSNSAAAAQQFHGLGLPSFGAVGGRQQQPPEDSLRDLLDGSAGAQRADGMYVC